MTRAVREALGWPESGDWGMGEDVARAAIDAWEADRRTH